MKMVGPPPRPMTRNCSFDSPSGGAVIQFLVRPDALDEPNGS